MLTVMTPLQPIVVPMMLRGHSTMDTPVLAASQIIIVRSIVPPLDAVMLTIMAIFEAIMASIIGRRITCISSLLFKETRVEEAN